MDDVARTRDRITLTGVRVRAHHGVFDFEREQGQEFVIDVSVAVDLSAAASGDDLGRTVHYGELAEAVVAAVERDPVDLIETVAEVRAERDDGAGHAWPRTIVTATSANGTPMGASGLCTVTSTSSTAG